jgi:hypothetical protein
MRHPKELTRTTEKEDLACCIHGLFLSSNHLPQKLVAWSKSCTQLGQYCWFMCSTKAVQGVEFLFEALTGMGFKNYAPPIGWLSRGRPKSNWNNPAPKFRGRDFMPRKFLAGAQHCRRHPQGQSTFVQN